MDVTVTTLDGKSAGKLSLSDDVFGLEPREDILQRMVRYQTLKRQSGTHKTKSRSEITGSTAKIYRQKGTGNARHGSKKPGIFIGGGKAFGPKPRSHAINLPKKIRALALRHALSAKAKSDSLIVLDDAKLAEPKTKALIARFADLGWSNALVIDGAELEDNFTRAASNIPNIDVLPIQGINVYDILRRDKLILTKAAVELLEARFNGGDND